ncbi:MAG: hypothetical protein AAFP19_11560 [Bacteroidota bacterium]
MNQQEKIQQLSAPWNEFKFDQPFLAYFSGGHERNQSILRKLIYEEYPALPSITLGALPPIITPIFWEVGNGIPREKIMQSTNPNQAIGPISYEHNKRLFDYQKRITKVYILNHESIRRFLIRSFISSGANKEIINQDMERRIKTCDLFINSIYKDEWTKLLLCIPELDTEVPESETSFTVTPKMHISLYRRIGFYTKNEGKFEYTPTENYFSKRRWKSAWNWAVDYCKDRADWPKGISSPEDIGDLRYECKLFNIQTIEILKKSFQNVKAELASHYSDVRESKNVSAFEWKLLLAKGETAQVIELMLNEFKEIEEKADDLNNLIILSSKWNEINKRFDLGIMDSKEFSMEKSKVDHSLINIIDR